jgi:prepilin-type N-terminal cleavage/methylation domain-containing protein
MTARALNPPPDCRGRSGFSLIEALIAAAILLIIALGLIPMFARAINDNTTGNDSTQSTNGGRTELEDMLGLPFANARLTITGGDTVSETTDFFAEGDPKLMGDPNEGWWQGAPKLDTTKHSVDQNKGLILWTRNTRVRQYSLNDLTSDPYLDTPLPGNTAPAFFQLKEIEVVMNNPKQADPQNPLGMLLGTGQGMTLRIIKPF